MPDACKAKTGAVKSIQDGAYFLRALERCMPGRPKGAEITIDGLRSTVTDVLARIEYPRRHKQVTRAHS